MRPTFSKGEYYHIYNRGTEKRNIFIDDEDLQRFFVSMSEFNSSNPIGSIFENNFRKRTLGGSTSKPEKLVEFIAYCLNPNHFHFVVRQRLENGVQQFMHRIGTGYTMYFNEKYKRAGALFQGRYKAKWVSSNEYLLYLSAYVNLNYEVHGLGGSTSKSSWDEYMGRSKEQLCVTGVVLDQFSFVTSYKEYSFDVVSGVFNRRQKEKGLGQLLLE